MSDDQRACIRNLVDALKDADKATITCPRSSRPIGAASRRSCAFCAMAMCGPRRLFERRLSRQARRPVGKLGHTKGEAEHLRSMVRRRKECRPSAPCQQLRRQRGRRQGRWRRLTARWSTLHVCFLEIPVSNAARCDTRSIGSPVTITHNEGETYGGKSQADDRNGASMKIVAELAESHEMPKKQLAAIFSDFISTTVKHLKKGSKVRVNGLGMLQVRKRPARLGRNPATGEQIKIKASKKVAFRPAKELKEAI